MVDAGSVMRSARRSVHPSSDPPSVGRDESSAVVEKAATLEKGGRKTRTGS